MEHLKFGNDTCVEGCGHRIIDFLKVWSLFHHVVIRQGKIMCVIALRNVQLCGKLQQCIFFCWQTGYLVLYTSNIKTGYIC